MLTVCAECKKQVSDKATACPHCGAPVTTSGVGVAVQTTERTAKRLKVHALLSALLCGVGVATMMAGWPEPGHKGVAPVLAAGFWVLLVGLGWFIVTRVRIWWNHG